MCIIPPNSFALARTVERFKIPRNVLTICLGKSTYARCGIIVNVTPLEPEWEGQVTLEFSNTTPLPAKIYANEGVAQMLFFESDEVCETSYADRKGKYPIVCDFTANLTKEIIQMATVLPFKYIARLCVITLLLVGCSTERTADEQWIHSQFGSYASAFSPNGKYVLVGDTGLPAKLWDIETNKVLYSWQSKAAVAGIAKDVAYAGTTTAVGFSGDSKVAATVEQDTIVLWEIATGEPMIRLSFPVKIKSLALSQHGDYLLLALYDRTAVYFDVIENRVLKVFEHDGKAVNSPINQLINAVAISPSGKYGLTGGDDQTARLWELATGKLLRTWNHKNSVNIVSFFPKGGFVLTGAGNGQTHFWNMKTGKER